MELFTTTTVRTLEHTNEGRDQWSSGFTAFALTPDGQPVAFAQWIEKPDATTVTVNIVGGTSAVLSGVGTKLGPQLVAARRWVEAHLG